MPAARRRASPRRRAAGSCAAAPCGVVVLQPVDHGGDVEQQRGNRAAPPGEVCPLGGVVDQVGHCGRERRGARTHHPGSPPGPERYRVPVVGGAHRGHAGSQRLQQRERARAGHGRQHEQVGPGQPVQDTLVADGTLVAQPSLELRVVGDELLKGGQRAAVPAENREGGVDAPLEESGCGAGEDHRLEIDAEPADAHHVERGAALGVVPARGRRRHEHGLAEKLDHLAPLGDRPVRCTEQLTDRAALGGVERQQQGRPSHGGHSEQPVHGPGPEPGSGGDPGVRLHHVRHARPADRRDDPQDVPVAGQVHVDQVEGCRVVRQPGAHPPVPPSMAPSPRLLRNRWLGTPSSECGTGSRRRPDTPTVAKRPAAGRRDRVGAARRTGQARRPGDRRRPTGPRRTGPRGRCAPDNSLIEREPSTAFRVL